MKSAKEKNAGRTRIHKTTNPRAWAYDFFHGGEALAQAELQEYGLGDHSIDEALSDDRAVVITRPDGSAIVSYRGTDHISDLAPDFQIALGYHHNPLLQSMGAGSVRTLVGSGNVYSEFISFPGGFPRWSH